MTADNQNDLPPCLIHIDKEGTWYHKGAQMIHREFIRLFYRHMELDPEGRYVIDLNGERCFVTVEDTAFVVRRVDETGDSAAGLVLYLSDDTWEELVPKTLWVGGDNILYCRVKGGKFPARFKRSAYYQLARYIEEEDGRYYLPLGGKRYPVLDSTSERPSS